MIKATKRDFVIIHHNGQANNAVVYGSTEGARADFSDLYDKEVRQVTTTLEGTLERGDYDRFTRTDLRFRYGDDESGDIAYLPSGLIHRNRLKQGDVPRKALLSVKLLPSVTEGHNDGKDENPSLYGWVSRAKNKAFHEPTRLFFSCLRPNPTDNGYMDDKGHCFCLDESDFQHIKAMDEPTPAVIEIRLIS